LHASPLTLDSDKEYSYYFHAVFSAIMTFKYNVLFILVFTTFLVNLFIFNVIQTKPYMDEEIHMEQAQNYCKGYLFRYDPRISTPPGLYVWPWLLSVLTRLLPVAGLDSFICGTLFLRLISSCFAILLWFELKNWSRLSRRKISPTQLLSLWTHAILFFYYFFYYTDVPSLYFGLLCLRYSYKCSPIIAALFGSLSTFHRQTSVIYHFISCLILTSGLWSQSLDFRPSRYGPQRAL
jgi:alpha-1,2-glucosyltransferase